METPEEVLFQICHKEVRPQIEKMEKKRLRLTRVRKMDWDDGRIQVELLFSDKELE